MDSNGLADPYVKLHLLPGASKVPYGLGLSASRAHRPWQARKVPSSEPKIALSAPKSPSSLSGKVLAKGERWPRIILPQGTGALSMSPPQKPGIEDLPTARKESDAPVMPLVCSDTFSGSPALALVPLSLPFYAPTKHSSSRNSDTYCL